MSNFNLTYKQITDLFREVCTLHAGIAQFDTGTIDYLDAVAVNKQYPYVFMRPVGSGYDANIRTLQFELYSLDVPKLDDESPEKLISDCEMRLWQIISYFQRGPVQQQYNITIDSMIPTNEAFQDRVFGWVATINVEVPFKFDYCAFPRANVDWFAIRAGLLGQQTSSRDDVTWYPDRSTAYYVLADNSLPFPDNIQNKSLYTQPSFAFEVTGSPYQANDYVSYKSGSDIGHATHWGYWVNTDSIGIEGTYVQEPWKENIYGLLNPFESGSDSNFLACALAYLPINSGSNGTAVYLKSVAGDYDFASNAENRPLQLVNVDGSDYNPASIPATASYVGVYLQQDNTPLLTSSLANYTARIYQTGSKTYLDNIVACQSSGPVPDVRTASASAAFPASGSVEFEGDVRQRGTGSWNDDGFFYSIGNDSLNLSITSSAPGERFFSASVQVPYEDIYYQAYIRNNKGELYTGSVSVVPGGEIYPGVVKVLFQSASFNSGYSQARPPFSTADNYEYITAYMQKNNCTGSLTWPSNVINRWVFKDPFMADPLLYDIPQYPDDSFAFAKSGSTTVLFEFDNITINQPDPLPRTRGFWMIMESAYASDDEYYNSSVEYPDDFIGVLKPDSCIPGKTLSSGSVALDVCTDPERNYEREDFGRGVLCTRTLDQVCYPNTLRLYVKELGSGDIFNPRYRGSQLFTDEQCTIPFTGTYAEYRATARSTNPGIAGGCLIENGIFLDSVLCYDE